MFSDNITMCPSLFEFSNNINNINKSINAINTINTPINNNINNFKPNNTIQKTKDVIINLEVS